MDSAERRIQQTLEPQPLLEGAGVRVNRSIGTPALNYLDPFLLLDHFSSEDPLEYQAGFPFHPHRGIETVTYVLSGVVQHRDTLGNSGTIGAGEVQWMTAGGGIMHEEMPQVRPEGIDGFQLWVNLPASLKMTEPRYRELRSSEIPEVALENGTRVRVIAGQIGAVRGPVTGIAADPSYMDVFLPMNSSFEYPVQRGHNVFSYVFEGEAIFSEEGDRRAVIPARRLVVFGDGEYLKVKTTSSPVRFLLVSGAPLGEPIARYGPFVMNTREEIEQALRELREGTFVRAAKG